MVTHLTYTYNTRGKKVLLSATNIICIVYKIIISQYLFLILYKYWTFFELINLLNFDIFRAVLFSSATTTYFSLFLTVIHAVLTSVFTPINIDKQRRTQRFRIPSVGPTGLPASGVDFRENVYTPFWQGVPTFVAYNLRLKIDKIGGCYVTEKRTIGTRQMRQRIIVEKFRPNGCDLLGLEWRNLLLHS